MDQLPEIEIALGAWSVGPGPLHAKLTAGLRRAVERRVLPPGTRLPSERELATQLVVSRSTVVAAYDALRGEGVLESRRGSGTRVARTAAPPQAGAGSALNPLYRSLLEKDAGDVISLACAISAAHPALAGAIVEVAAEAGATLLTTTGYAPFGVPALRRALAEFHTAAGLPTTEDQVLVTTGAQQAIDLCASLFVRAGDRVVVESPGFAGTMDTFRARAAELISAEVDGDGVDVGRVREAVHHESPSLVYLMPSFHNPTGAVLDRGRRAALAELAAVSGVPLVEDNALEQTTLGTNAPPAVAAHGPADAPVITVGSFSKLVWGGLRVGWLRGPRRLVARLGEVKARTDLGTPMFDQAVAARLLGDLDGLRAVRTAHLQAGLDLVSGLLATHLPEWHWQRPAGGPSLWVRLPEGTAAGFAQVALRHGVEVIPGSVMSPHGGHTDHFRLPFTAAPDVLETVVTRLAAAWGSYASGQGAHHATAAVVV